MSTDFLSYLLEDKEETVTSSSLCPCICLSICPHLLAHSDRDGARIWKWPLLCSFIIHISVSVNNQITADEHAELFRRLWLGLGMRPGGDEGKEAGNRIPGALEVPPLRLPVAAPSSLPSLAAVFQFSDRVNDRMAERRESGSGTSDDVLSLRPAEREASCIIEWRCWIDHRSAWCSDWHWWVM